MESVDTTIVSVNYESETRVNQSKFQFTLTLRRKVLHLLTQETETESLQRFFMLKEILNKIKYRRLNVSFVAIGS